MEKIVTFFIRKITRNYLASSYLSSDIWFHWQFNIVAQVEVDVKQIFALFHLQQYGLLSLYDTCVCVCLSFECVCDAYRR